MLDIPGILDKNFSIIYELFDVEQEEIIRGYDCNIE